MYDRWFALYTAAAAGGLLLMESAIGQHEGDARSALIAVFYGASADGFVLMPYLYLMITSLGLAMVLHAGLVHRLGHGLYTELLREGSVYRWLGRYLRRSVAFALTATTGLLMLHLAFFAVHEGLSSLWAAGAGATYAYFVGAGTAQVVVLVLVLLAVTLLSGQLVAGAPAAGLLLVSALPFAFSLGILPIGLNSLSIAWDGPSAMVQAGITLGAWTTILLILCLGVAPRTRDFSFH